MTIRLRKKIWPFLGPSAVALLLLTFILMLWEPITYWLQGEERYNNEVLREWIEESRVYSTLPDLVSTYLDLLEDYNEIAAKSENLPQLSNDENNAKTASPMPFNEPDELRVILGKLKEQRNKIYFHLKSLGDPLTTVYRSQLPLFPVVYRIEVEFDKDLRLAPVIWESELPRQESQYRRLPEPLKVDPRGAYVQLLYQMRVYSSQQYNEQLETARRLRFGGLTVMLIGACLLGVYIVQIVQRERQRQKMQAEQQLHEAERLRLREELRRQEAEKRHQEAERLNLELKSQLWANIGIMAGSYAHNIKNLLVRPNDLLNRCLERPSAAPEHDDMLREVQHTLGTVTERLQQILQTVRSDPTQSKLVLLDLNKLLEELVVTWRDLAHEKWKLTIKMELAGEPLWIEGDRSHLQQGLENLLFNARDATFEMRQHLREQARKRSAMEVPADKGLDKNDRDEMDRRKAIIAAAGWKGEVLIRSLCDNGHAVVEVRDNGIGMNEEVRQRCTQAHFSTKRNNALFAGMNAGMGLGLSFILVILEHHRATLTIESAPLQGATFRIRFPLITHRGGERR